MVFGITITSSTDHFRMTLGNGAFYLDGEQWQISHTQWGGGGVLPDAFYCYVTATEFSLGQTQMQLRQLSATVRINVPDGTQFLTFHLDRGGLGTMLIVANLPASGTVTPLQTGDYALPLTLQAIAQREQELGITPTPKPNKA